MRCVALRCVALRCVALLGISGLILFAFACDNPVDIVPKFAVIVEEKDAKDGDSVTITPASGKDGDSITVNYELANLADINMLEFSGVNLNPVNSAGKGSKAYVIDKKDAVNSVIIIKATFIHKEKEEEPEEPEEPATEYTVEVSMVGNQEGDIVTVTPDKGEAGDTFTINYTVANRTGNNQLIFSSVDIAPVNSAGTGTRNYVLKPEPLQLVITIQVTRKV